MTALEAVQVDLAPLREEFSKSQIKAREGGRKFQGVVQENAGVNYVGRISWNAITVLNVGQVSILLEVANREWGKADSYQRGRESSWEY